MRPTRRELVRWAGAGALSLPLASRLRLEDAVEGQAGRPPNLLFLMTDQQRWDSLSIAGNSVIETPNLDALAKSGAFFREMSCLSPVCGPSRAALLSGLLFRGHKCNGSVNQFATKKTGMTRKLETYDESLAAAGYRVEYFGKWHTGRYHQEVYESGLRTHYLSDYEAEMRAKHPAPGPYRRRKMVEDKYTGLLFNPYPVHGLMAGADQRHRGNEDDPKIHHDPETGWSDIPEEDSLTAWLTKRAIRFLESEHERPFALTLSLLHPHAPLVTHGRYTDLLDPAKMPMPENVFDDENRGQLGVPAIVPLTPNGLGRFIAQYYALVVEIDDWIGRLLATFDRLGLRDNTLIVFTSDHGELMGSHGHVGKSRFFEEAIRVPMLLSLPGRIPAGTVLDEPVCGIDLAPTILDYCLGDVPEGRFDGVSLRGAVEGEGLGRELVPIELNRLGMRARGLRSGNWKLAISERYGQRLYDLEKDPLELTNLIAPGAEGRAPHVEVANRLREELAEYLAEHDDYLLRELPPTE